MAKSLLVCDKCGMTAEITDAVRTDWLKAQRNDKPQGFLIIRCPNCINEYARRLANLPRQIISKKVINNLETGLWINYGDGYTAYAYSWEYEKYTLTYHKGDNPPFKSEQFDMVEDLIVAMREIDNLSKWRVKRE